jgi:hypothetical protein
VRLSFGEAGVKRKGISAGIAGVMVCIGFGSAFDPAEAACRQVLAPNGWQRITVCNNQSGANYSGAIAAGVAGAAIALELLPDVLNSVGDITSGVTAGVGDVTSGVVSNFGDAAASATNASSLNPFNFFNQQPEAAAPAAKKKNSKQDDATPSLFGLFSATPQVNVRAPNVNTPQVNIRTPDVNAPQVNIRTPNVNTPTPQVNVRPPNVNSPQVNIRTPQVNAPDIDSYR